jgi:hypothetical protein
LRAHLKVIGSRWRKLPAGKIAVIVLAVLRHDQRLADMAGGNDVSPGTVRRWAREILRLLAARAPRLDRALTKIARQGGEVVPKVLFTFGREDDLDREAIKRLVASLSRLLDPCQALAATAASDLEFTSSATFGGAHVLDHLWRRLRIDQIVARVGQPKRGRRRDMTTTERVLFALVANRALAPSSKLAAAEWISQDVHIDGLPATSDDACYRAMDWLHEVKDDLEKQVFDEVANLLNLEVDLLFFDTTSTYFELEEPDAPVIRDERGDRLPDDDADADGEDGQESAKAGFRTYGKSKDARDDLPQIVIGMAVTRDGIPVRCWCWPGNASDQTLIRQVKDDMRDWTLAALRRPAPERRGHRRRLPATAGSGARLARHEADHRPAAGLSPARRTHPRPRHPLLARPATHPDHRDHHRRHLTDHTPRARPYPPRHLHRTRRPVPAGHRPHQASNRPTGHARRPPP